MKTFTDLKNAVPNLNAKDAAFAGSLLQQWARPGGLSGKQMYWVGVLVDRAANGGQDAPKAPTADGINLAPLAEMFKRAAKRLKYPKISILVGSTALTLSLAGAQSRNPGFIYVKHSGTYAGKVSPGGEYSGSELVVEALREISKDPAGAASRHGHVTGNCCFCKIALTDERSIAVGYGKICAAHYQLPWGKAAAAAAKVEDAEQLLTQAAA